MSRSKWIRSALLVLAITALSGCFHMNLGSGGSHCVGLCPENFAFNTTYKVLYFDLPNKVVFDRSISADADNFFRMHRLHPEDPHMKNLMKDFLEPARRVHRQIFDVEPDFTIAVLPAEARIQIRAASSDWIAVDGGSRAHVTFGRLDADGSARSYRWKYSIETTGSLGGDASFTTASMRASEADGLGRRLSSSLTIAYTDFFKRQYGASVKMIDY
jgi:hypothetical protein